MLKKYRIVYGIIFSLLHVISLSSIAQQSYEFSFKEKKEIIDTISILLENEYIEPKITHIIIDSLNSKLDNGRYSNISEDEFAYRITMDLFEASNDRHFYFQYNPDEAKIETDLKYGNVDERQKAHQILRERSKQINFGFEKVERLRGNIGYLDLRAFENPKYGGETALASMQFLSNTDAMIIDLRKNHGGFEEMVKLLCSYFFDDEKMLRTFLFKSGYEKQSWTMPYVPGYKTYDKDLYILISNETGSAAEAFSYFMKNSKRAILIGEISRGAAHNVRPAVISNHFILNLPNKKPIDPITNSNWEKVGVQPNIITKKENAFEKAYFLAIDNLMNSNESNKFDFELEWEYCSLNEKINPIKITPEMIKDVVGTYENKIIYNKKDKLYYKQNENTINEIIPISNNIYKILGIDDIRLKFIYKNNTVVKLEIIYSDGWKFVKEKEKIVVNK